MLFRKKQKKSTNKCCLISFLSFCISLYMIYFLWIYKSTHNYSKEEITRKSYSNFTELLFDLQEYKLNSSDILTEKLFPWLYYFQNNSQLNLYLGEKNTKGIVICTGNQHFGVALVTITALQILQNELPIEVIYSTSDDLSLDNQNKLKSLFPNIRLIDLSTMAFNDNYSKLRGWEIKPFAILASRFEQVLLIDADVLFFEKPSILFEKKSYRQTGTLFFYDRPQITENMIEWIQTFSIDKNQSFPIRTQESGVILMDKSRLLLGLLTICKLNDYQERQQVTYKYLYGDKDTWWIGLHMMNISYSFLPTMTAGIGEIKRKTNQTILCGKILHFDEDKKLLWWNGGLLKNRAISTKILLKVDAWMEEGQWKIQTYSCLTNNQQIPNKFNHHQQQLIDKYFQITKQIFNIS